MAHETKDLFKEISGVNNSKGPAGEGVLLCMGLDILGLQRHHHFGKYPFDCPAQGKKTSSCASCFGAQEAPRLVRLHIYRLQGPQ